MRASINPRTSPLWPKPIVPRFSTTSQQLHAHFQGTNEDKPKDFDHENTCQLLPSRGRKCSRPWLRVGRMLNLVSATEQILALALDSKSACDFANSVRDDESVAHTPWSASVVAAVVTIAHGCIVGLRPLTISASAGDEPMAHH